MPMSRMFLVLNVQLYTRLHRAGPLPGLAVRVPAPSFRPLRRPGLVPLWWAKQGSNL